MTMDFQTNKRVCEEVAIIPSKALKNKIAGYATHLMKRIQRGPVRGISLKLQEEERERRMDFVPEVSAVDTDIIDVTDVDFDSSSPESLAHVIKSFTPVPFDSVSTPTASPTLLRPKPLSSGTPSGSGSRTRARVRTALASAKSRLAMARSFRTVATDLAEAVVVPLRQTPVRSLARGGS